MTSPIEAAPTKSPVLRSGWRREGTLGSGTSLLARDPDRNLLEFVGESAAEPNNR